ESDPHGPFSFSSFFLLFFFLFFFSFGPATPFSPCAKSASWAGPRGQRGGRPEGRPRQGRSAWPAGVLYAVHHLHAFRSTLERELPASVRETEDAGTKRRPRR